jgi:hypothetical protein
MQHRSAARTTHFLAVTSPHSINILRCKDTAWTTPLSGPKVVPVSLSTPFSTGIHFLFLHHCSILVNGYPYPFPHPSDVPYFPATPCFQCQNMYAHIILCANASWIGHSWCALELTTVCQTGSSKVMEFCPSICPTYCEFCCP